MMTRWTGLGIFRADVVRCNMLSVLEESYAWYTLDHYGSRRMWSDSIQNKNIVNCSAVDEMQREILILVL